MPNVIDKLKNLERKEYYRLVVDGERHSTENGWQKYDEREPNSVPRILLALRFSFTDLSRQLSVDLIKDIHRQIVENVQALKDVKAGKFRPPHIRGNPFWLSVKPIVKGGESNTCVTENGFQELFCSTVSGELLSGSKLFLPLNIDDFIPTEFAGFSRVSVLNNDASKPQNIDKDTLVLQVKNDYLFFYWNENGKVIDESIKKEGWFSNADDWLNQDYFSNADLCFSQRLQDFIKDYGSLKLQKADEAEWRALEEFTPAERAKKIWEKYVNKGLRNIPYLPGGDPNQLVGDLCSKFNNEINTAEDKLKTIANFIQTLERIHPFADANLRTCVILLQRLLIKNGFLPTMMNNPNCFDGYSLNELVQEIKNGIARTEKILLDPSASLFNYQTPDRQVISEGSACAAVYAAEDALYDFIHSPSFTLGETSQSADVYAHSREVLFPSKKTSQVADELGVESNKGEVPGRHLNKP